MTHSIRNEIVRASAGTGKTFQLSNRYLNLIVRGIDCPSILATTFTRKAAGEILDRIVQRLSAAALDDKAANELGGFIGLPNLPASRCRKILADAMRQLHRLQISTLDSFFSRLARSFSLEMGLLSDWRIVNQSEYEYDLLRDEAIHRLLQLGAVNPVLHLLGKGEANRSISREIRTAVDNLYSIYLDSTPDAWKQIPESKLLSDAEVQGVVDQLLALEIEHANIRKTINKDLQSLMEGERDSFIGKGVSGKVAAGETTYSRKEIPADAIDLLKVLIGDVTKRELNQIAKQTLANFEVLQAYDAIYSAIKSERDVVEYDDISRNLAKFVASASTGSISYRLDRRINHLLLDEFQDTSPIQWNAIRPFAEHVTEPESEPGNRSPENLQGERSFFCVGDTKQAIYGWRGGEAEIFDTVDRQLPDVHEADPLIASYRSSPVIIETVNQSFLNMVNHDSLDANEGSVRRWCEKFQQHVTNKDLPGYVTMETSPESVDTLEFAAERIAQTYREIPDKSMGVLVRKNATVGQLIGMLARLGIPASEDAGNPLTDSAAVCLILSALRLADHPGNRIAWFHLQNSTLGTLFGFVTKAGKVLEYNAAKIADASADMRRTLLENGYGPTIEKWANVLLPACTKRERSRLMQLVELGFNASAEATLRPTDFAKHIESSKVSDPSAARVRVMNVHQAKGLEFDIVFLPEVDGPLMPRTPQWVSWRERPGEPIRIVSKYIKDQLRPLTPPAIQQVFDTYREKTINEKLCWLYVALTRSRQAMHILIAPTTSKKLPKSASGLLRAALAPDEDPQPGRVLFHDGESDWWRQSEETPQQELSEATTGVTVKTDTGCFLNVTLPADTDPIRLAAIDVDRVSNRIAASPSRMAIKPPQSDAKTPSLLKLPALRIDDILDGTHGGVAGDDRARYAADRGTLIHRWFEQIQWLGTKADRQSVSPERLDQIAASMIDLKINLRKAKEDFQTYLNQPATKELLSREFYDKTGKREGQHTGKVRAEVFTERRFAVQTEQGIQTGIIDRLVLIYEDDKLNGADIIDFKTDTVNADDPNDLDKIRRYHAPQQNAYRRAVSQLYQLPLNSVTARLLFVSAGVVMPIEQVANDKIARSVR